MPYGEHDKARSLRDPEERDRRRSLLSEPHVAPLTEFVDDLRRRLPGAVPDFDPLDGGVNATILFLFEQPGPMTDASRKGRSGSEFISRNNDDATAAATFNFMITAAVPHRHSLIWNVIPWWDGHIRFTGADRTVALGELNRLIALLPQLHTVVLVGRTAAKARPHLRDLRVLEGPHPSPKVRNTNRALWDSIPDIWRRATLPIVWNAQLPDPLNSYG